MRPSHSPSCHVWCRPPSSSTWISGVQFWRRSKAIKWCSCKRVSSVWAGARPNSVLRRETRHRLRRDQDDGRGVLQRNWVSWYKLINAKRRVLGRSHTQEGTVWRGPLPQAYVRLHWHRGETTKRMRRTIEVHDNSGCFDIFQTPDLVVLLVFNTYNAPTRSDLSGQERLHRQTLLSTTRQECCRLLCRSYKGRVIESGMSKSIIVIDQRRRWTFRGWDPHFHTWLLTRIPLSTKYITVARLPILNAVHKMTS